MTVTFTNPIHGEGKDTVHSKQETFFQAPRNPMSDLQHKLSMRKVKWGFTEVMPRDDDTDAIRCAHEKDHSTESSDRDGQGPPAFVVVSAHPEPETHH